MIHLLISQLGNCSNVAVIMKQRCQQDPFSAMMRCCSDVTLIQHYIQRFRTTCHQHIADPTLPMLSNDAVILPLTMW